MLLLLLPFLLYSALGARLPDRPPADVLPTDNALTDVLPSSLLPTSAPPSPQRRLPSALVIGVKKGGTRALLEALRLHPDVAAPGPEVHFFDRYYDRGLEWYRSQMPETGPGLVTVEKTPSYFVTKAVPARVAAFDPGARLLVVVRDPVTRALSDYAQTSSKRPGLPSFPSMAFRNDSSVNASWGGVRLGLYARHLQRWLVHFPLASLHFVSGEGLIREPWTELAGVESFLGLRPFISRAHFAFDAAKGFPCLRKAPDAAPHCLGRTKGRTHPKPSLDETRRLRAFFAPHNAHFYRLVGRDFGW